MAAPIRAVRPPASNDVPRARARRVPTAAWIAVAVVVAVVAISLALLLALPVSAFAAVTAKAPPKNAPMVVGESRSEAIRPAAAFLNIDITENSSDHTLRVSTELENRAPFTDSYRLAACSFPIMPLPCFHNALTMPLQCFYTQ